MQQRQVSHRPQQVWSYVSNTASYVPECKSSSTGYAGNGLTNAAETTPPAAILFLMTFGTADIVLKILAREPVVMIEDWNY